MWLLNLNIINQVLHLVAERPVVLDDVVVSVVLVVLLVARLVVMPAGVEVVVFAVVDDVLVRVDGLGAIQETMLGTSLMRSGVLRHVYVRSSLLGCASACRERFFGKYSISSEPCFGSGGIGRLAGSCCKI